MKTFILLVLAALVAIATAGGASWCTFNDDCMGWSDARISERCCNEVKHSAFWDTTHNVCRGKTFGKNSVNHGHMVACCELYGGGKGMRMCGCKNEKYPVMSSPRNVTLTEYRAFSLSDRPEPPSIWEDKMPLNETDIPLGHELTNTIFDIHFPSRNGGKDRRLPAGRGNHNDYSCHRAPETFGGTISNWFKKIFDLRPDHVQAKDKHYHVYNGHKNHV